MSPTIYDILAKVQDQDALDIKNQVAASITPAMQKSNDLYSSTVQTIKDGYDNKIIAAMADMPDLEDNLLRWRLAKEYSGKYGISDTTAFQMLDQLNADYLMGKPTYKSALSSIIDSGRAAALSVKMGKLASQYMGTATGLGFLEDIGIAKPKSDEEKKALMDEITSIQKEMATLQIDDMPKHWFKSFLKLTASVVPYTADIVATGAVAAGATALAGGTLGLSGLAWFPAARNFVAATTRFAEGFQIMRGMSFLEMKERGISEEDAKFWSDASAAAGAALESFLGTEAFLSSAIGSGAKLPLVEGVLTRMAASGIGMSPALKFAGRVALSTLGEMVEEGSQEFIDGFATIFAEEASLQGYQLNPMTAGQVARNAATSVWQAMITAPLLGLGGDVMLYFQDKKALATLAQVAPSMKKDDFAKLAVASTVFQNVPPGAATELAKKMWAAQTDKEAKKLIEAREQVKAQAKAGPAKGDAEIDRTPEGMVYVTPESQPVVSLDGSQNITFLAGSAKDGRTMYGDIEVTIQNGRIVINGGNIDTKFTGYASEMLAGIAARYPGMKVELGQDVEDAALIGGYEKLVADRGETPFAEQNEADAIEEDRLYREITTNIAPDPAVAKSAIAALRAFSYGARKDGKPVSFAEFVSGLGFRDLADLGDKGSNAMGAFVKGVNGLVNELKNPMIYGDSRLPSSLLAGEVLAHEGMHYFRAFLSKYDPENLQLKEVEKEYGIKNGIWDMASDERFVSDFLAWTRDRTAPTPEMGNIFQRIGEFLKKVYQAIKGELPEKVRKAFDEWFGSYEGENIEEIDQAEVPDAEKVAKPTHTETMRAEKAKARLEKAIPAAMAKTGRPREYFDEVIRMFGSFTSGMGSGWLSDPILIAKLKKASGILLDADEQALLDMANGMTEGETPAQPLFAEAPPLDSENFKKWFKESAIVDRDGNPMRAYRGDVSEVAEFEYRDRGIYFTDTKGAAEFFTDGYVGEYYLSIQKPFTDEQNDFFDEFLSMAEKLPDTIDIKRRWKEFVKHQKNGTFSPMMKFPAPSIRALVEAYRKSGIDFISELKSRGYDGWVGTGISGVSDYVKEIVAFDPTQIKSVNNSGAWGLDEPNIYKAEGNPDFFRESLNEGEVQKDRIRADYETDAKDYATFEKWMDSQYASWDSMAESDIEWHKAWYEHAHSKEGKDRQYPKKGDFLTFLRSGNEFRNLMYHIGKALYGKDRYLDDASEQRASRIQGALSRSPEVMRAVEAMYKEGKTPATAVKNRFIAEARKHEALYKYLYALVTTDENLAYEALSDLKSLPLLARRELTGSEQISIVDQAEILDALRGTELAEKVKDGSITMAEVREYVKMIESKAKAEVKGAKRDAKKEIREKLAARKLLREMERIQKFIMRRPSSGSVAYFNASFVRAIQDAMRAEKPIDKKSLPMTGSYYAATDADWNARLDSVITFINNEVARSAKKGSLDIEALKSIAGIIKDQLDIGRRVYREEQLAWGLDVKNTRSKILSEFKGGKYYKPELQPGSEEYRKQQKKLDAIGAQFDADRPDAWIRTYMGKEAADLLFNESLRARSLALENYDRRVKPVIDFIAEHKMMKKDKLLRTVTAKGLWGGPENITTVTGSELVGMYALVGTETEFNQWQRDAFIYGNLFSAEERDADGTLRDPSEPSGNQYMMGKYKEKLDAVLAFLKDNITDEEVALAKTMIAVMNNDFDWYRFAHTMVGLTNDEPGKEAFYFPILREGMFEDGEDETLDKLGKSFEMTKLDNRMAIQRRKIQPKDQKPVKYDALAIFYEAVSRQEYLTEVGPYIKKIRGVWKHNIQSRSMRDIIRDSIGQKGLDYIDKQIDTLTNPAQFKKKADGSEMLSFFRGAFVVSNLSWRLSSVVMQLLTSPMTGYVEAPLEMLPNSIKAYTNPKKFIEETEAISPMLRHRHILPEHADMLKRQMLGASNTLENIGIAGMKWLDIADRVSVAIVWKAIYDKRTKAGDGSLEAADYADRFILQTQPTSEAADRAPMYRDQDSFKALVLQFTQPMNVIYNNLRHDITELAREKEYGKICAFITAYAMSGIAIAAVGVLRGRGPDDPDEEKWVKYWLHASTSQFTDAIPFVGDIVTGLTGTAIIGDNNSWLRNDKNMPAFDLVARGVEGLFSENRDYAKVMVNVAKGMGMMASAPVKAVEDMVKLTKSMLGEE